MTFKYNNVYINETSTVVGPYEAKGPLSKLYDKSYDDFYFGYPVNNNTYNLNPNNNVPYDQYINGGFNQSSYNNSVIPEDLYKYPGGNINQGINPNNSSHMQNYNHLYPSIYRILDPVVKKVVYSSGNTY